MTSMQYVIPFLALALLVPLGVTSSMAQQAPGEDEYADEIGPVAVTDELAALDEVIERYADELETTDDSEYAQAVENAVERLEIAKAIYQTVRGHADIREDYQDKTLDELFVLLDATYDPEDFTTSEEYTGPSHVTDSLIGGEKASIQYVHSHTKQIDVQRNNNHYQSQYDCVDRKAARGSALSVLTSYTDGTAIITGDFSYPANLDKSIGERRGSTCTDFDHTKTVKRHDVLIAAVPGSGDVPAQVCTLTERNPEGSESVGCNAFGPNRVTLITTTNTYDATESSKNTQLGTTQVTLLIS